jgi:hypothetical protein
MAPRHARFTLDVLDNRAAHGVAQSHVNSCDQVSVSDARPYSCVQDEHLVVQASQRGVARWTRQDRRLRPGPQALANPFALRRELLPTSPNFLDHTRTHHTLSVPPHHTPAALENVGCLTCRHSVSGTTYHVQRSNSKMSSVRLSPRPPFPRHARRLPLLSMPASSH